MSRSARPLAPPAPSAILIAPLKPAANLPEPAAQLASADNPSAVLGCIKPSRKGVSAPLTVDADRHIGFERRIETTHKSISRDREKITARRTARQNVR